MKVFIAICLLAYVSATFASDYRCQVDMALIIDRSGSIWKDQPNQEIGEQNWNQVQRFVALLIQKFNVSENDTQIALVSFSSKASLEFNLGEKNKSAMIEEAENLKYNIIHGGATHTDTALTIVRDEIFTGSGGDRSDVANVVVLLTDGRTSENHEERTSELAEELKKDDTFFFAVGVTNQVDISELGKLATDLSNVKIVDSFSELNELVEQLHEDICNISNGFSSDLLPWCQCANQDAIVFSAHSTIEGSSGYRVGAVLQFNDVFTNNGNSYDPDASVFTCRCNGFYEFHVTLNTLTPSMGIVIMRDDDIVSSMAYTSASISAFTTTIIQCNQGQQVYVEVISIDPNSFMNGGSTGISTMSFTGKLLT